MGNLQQREQYSEIDLVGLGIIFLRRWRMISAVFLIVFTLGIIAAILKTPTYSYTTTLKLGVVYSQNGTIIPLMSSSSVAQIMKSIYVPSAILQYSAEKHMDISSLKVDVKTYPTDNNEAVVLECKVKEPRAQACIAVEKSAAAAFVRDNSQATTIAQNILASLQSEEQVLRVTAEKLKTSKALYRQQAKELQKHIEDVKKVEIDSAIGTSKPADALSNLLLSTQVQQSMDQLSAIQQKLNVDIPRDQAALAKKITDNKRAQWSQEQLIVQNTAHVLNAGMKSLQPVGIGRSLIVGVSIILGFLLAVFAALLANYIQQIHVRLDTESI